MQIALPDLTNFTNPSGRRNFADFAAGLLAPLQSLASRWIKARGVPRPICSGLHYVAVRPSCGLPPAGAATAADGHALNRPRASNLPHATRPLRVVRRVDARQPGLHPSRIVISGRLADVCAELDRLAALEAAETRSLAEIEAMAAIVGRTLRQDRLH